MNSSPDIISLVNKARALHEAVASSAPKIRLIRFSDVKLDTGRRDLVKGFIPHAALTVVWGKPKCGKSFWLFDCLAHVALGWKYRGRRVHAGPVVYCAFEGQRGLEARIEAFRLKHLEGYSGDVPFYLEPVTLNLVNDHAALITAIRETLTDSPPVAVALDTLNRSLHGSESSDEDMAAYIQAADAIREAFQCAVVIVHHCGHNADRMRGHSSLTGALDAEIAVTRDQGVITAELKLAKDGAEGDQIVSVLEPMDVGIDVDGDPITAAW